MTFYQLIGKNLKKLRKEHLRTQAYVADILDIKQPYYSQLESGTKEISVKQLYKVKKAFDVSMDSFFQGIDLQNEDSSDSSL